MREVLALEPSPPALVDSAGNVVLPGDGMVLLSGKTRSYKTFLAIEWAFRLAAKGKNVAFLEAEGFKAMGKRIAAFVDAHSWANIDTERIAMVDMKAVLQEVGAEFTDDPPGYLASLLVDFKADVAIVDTFRTIGEVVNENDNAEVGAALKKLRYLAPLVIIVHHTRKDNRIYAGAGAFDTNTDTSYELARPDDDAASRVVELICHGHRDYEPPPSKGYEFTPLGDSGYLEPIDIADHRLAMQNASSALVDEQIVSALDGGMSLSSRAIADILGWTQPTAYRKLSSAVERGLLVKAKAGRAWLYSLPGTAVPI